MLIAKPELFTNPNKAKIIRLETQIKILEDTETQSQEEIENEREIHTDAMKNMDNFYQHNPPQENIRLKNILREFEQNYLKINRQNQQQDQKIKDLEKSIELTEKIIEQEHQPKATQDQGTQTDLT
ncbi:23661_t:CDS:2 [Entrophospora sp. SA101]|nr:15096_t:CDS:2 [Entrophospora sp. SA101]CAJ0749011.1 23661_t:CDS:2 [Entrophospora sp. SA101]CAJ0824576.1 22173_t:CDS:2 [Entrophospora sp. SA101]CAJ0845116.1 8015_t:CDS:2 [Entrophospora sp. SA101]